MSFSFADYGGNLPTRGNLTATGSTQATAFPLPSRVNYFSTVPSGSGCMLPQATVSSGIEITIINRGANALLVYPSPGGQIEALGVNTPISVDPGSAAVLITMNATVSGRQWFNSGATGVFSGDASSATVTATGSSSPRSLANWAADVINVKNFGATGNGTTDDTAPITTALTYARTSGSGCVYFPTGIYRVSSNFLVPSFTAVVGDGSQSSIIKCAAAGSTGGGIFYSANDALYASGSTGNPPPVSPSVQTDQSISLRGLGFDFSLAGNNISSFMFAKNIVVDDIYANDGKAYTAGGYGGALRFIGCDNCKVSNLNVTNVVNAVDVWYGSTRIQIDNASVESVGGNGGVFNYQGVGTSGQQNHSYDYHASNISIRLHTGCGFFLDSQGSGSQTTDVHLSNVMIDALTGTTNQAIVGRGFGGRIHVENMTVKAETGASYGTQPILVGVFFSYIGPATGTNLVATTNGSGVINVTFPSGIDAGPGNYALISNGSGGAVVGNGLTLNGYYLITAVTGNVATCTVPAQIANATGTISATTSVVGYQGSYNNCTFKDITFDGAMASGATLFALQGSNHLVDGVIVTENYGGPSTPQYNSIIAWDSTPISSDTPTSVASTFVNIKGAPGTGSLISGYTGNNIVQWTSLTPIIIGYLPGVLITGTATSATDLVNGIQFAGGYGLNAYNFGLDVNAGGGGAIRFLVAGTQYAYINATGFSGPVGQQSGAESPGAFTILSIGSVSGPTVTRGNGAPSSTQPNSSLYLRTDGTTGSRLYVSAGGGTWSAVAGV